PSFTTHAAAVPGGNTGATGCGAVRVVARPSSPGRRARDLQRGTGTHRRRIAAKWNGADVRRDREAAGTSGFAGLDCAYARATGRAGVCDAGRAGYVCPSHDRGEGHGDSGIRTPAALAVCEAGSVKKLPELPKLVIAKIEKRSMPRDKIL